MFFFTYISSPIFPYENSSHQLSRQERKHASFSILIPIMPNKRSYSAQRNSDLLHAKASSTTRQIIKAIPKASFSFSFFFLLFISTTTTYVQIHQPNAGNYRKKIHVQLLGYPRLVLFLVSQLRFSIQNVQIDSFCKKVFDKRTTKPSVFVSCGEVGGEKIGKNFHRCQILFFQTTNQHHITVAAKKKKNAERSERRRRRSKKSILSFEAAKNTSGGGGGRRDTRVDTFQKFAEMVDMARSGGGANYSKNQKNLLFIYSIGGKMRIDDKSSLRCASQTSARNFRRCGGSLKKLSITHM